MKKLFLLLILISSSCSTSKIEKSNLGFLKVIKSSGNLLKISKSKSIHVNYNDTLIEKKYYFFIPKKSKKYYSSVSNMPTIHSFNYSKKEQILVLKNNSTFKMNISNLDKEEFRQKINQQNLSRNIFTHFSIHDIKFLENRKFGIFNKGSILYLFINYKDNNDIQKNIGEISVVTD